MSVRLPVKRGGRPPTLNLAEMTTDQLRSYWRQKKRASRRRLKRIVELQDQISQLTAKPPRIILLTGTEEECVELDALIRSAGMATLSHEELTPQTAFERISEIRRSHHGHV